MNDPCAHGTTLGSACTDASSEQVKPAPDVTDEEWEQCKAVVAALHAPRASCCLHDKRFRWPGVTMTRMAELACEIELEEAHKTIKLRQLPGKARLRLDGPADPALPRRRNGAQYPRLLRARGARCLIDMPYRWASSL